MLELLKKLVPVGIAAALFMGGWQLGHDAADSTWKEKVNNEYITKVQASSATQRELSELSASYQAKLAASEKNAARTLDDVRSSGERLRVKLKAAERQLDGNGRCVIDGKAELDDETAKSLIRITQDGDAQIEALQETIRKLQNK